MQSSITPPDANQPTNQIVNVPNALSMLRLLLALIVGILIELGAFKTSIVVFVIAASTDFLDGYWARRYNQITKLGRMLDPFVDKIIICAAMIALVGYSTSGVRAWMVTVIVGRELLVTTLRSMVEGKGGDFSARWLGKWKMFAQCAAVVASLLLLSRVTDGQWLAWTTHGLLWVAIALTVASGVDYVLQVIRISKHEVA